MCIIKKDKQNVGLPGLNWLLKILKITKKNKLIDFLSTNRLVLKKIIKIYKKKPFDWCPMLLLV